MKSIRESFYKTALEFGLFYLMPVVVRLPKSLSRQILRLKAATRFLLGSYRAYVDRPGLKKIAISNIIETLKTDKKSAGRILYRLMQLEVFSEKNGFLLDSYTLSDMEACFNIYNMERLDKEVKKGRGVIFATIHSGDTLMLMLYLALRGYKIYGLFDSNIQYKETKNALESLAKLKDRKIDGKIGKLYTKKGLTRLFDVLDENGIIVWMVDLPAPNPKRRTVIDFLDKKISVSNSLMEVADRTGASVLPHITIYDGRHDRHNVFVGDPLCPETGSVQDLFNFFEPYTRRYPDSWLGWYIFDMLKTEV